jgi:hypothetical protein
VHLAHPAALGAQGGGEGGPASGGAHRSAAHTMGNNLLKSDFSTIILIFSTEEEMARAKREEAKSF